MSSSRLSGRTWHALLAVTLLVCHAGNVVGQTAPPNIVLILTDDQGWNGTSVQMDPNVPGSKSDFYQTPRLEQLAADGMRFANGYASAPTCAPTRAAIQTGVSPARQQMTDLHHALPPGSSRWLRNYTGYPLTPPAPEHFDPNQLTLPRVLKQANSAYVTGHFGKWHLDQPSTTTPEVAGYDIGGDNRPNFDPDLDPRAVFELSDLANTFIEDRVNNSEPFFVQISHRAPHRPIQFRQEIRDKYAALPPGTVHDDPEYAAMIEDLDTSIGTVLDKISALGIEENTYVIFASDNGGVLADSSNAPLAVGKSSIKEGGIRVPFIVKGPNIAANSTSHVPISTTDLFSTLADIAGFAGPMPEEVEGTSFLPVLENSGALPSGVGHLQRNHHQGGELYWHYPFNVGMGGRTIPSSAVRDGDYKLIVQYGENGASDQHFLYDLSNDIGETTNLVSAMPELAAELQGKLESYLENVDASFAFDVKEPVTMQWDASQAGVEAEEWRTSNDLRNKSREVWHLGQGTARPNRRNVSSFQPGLPNNAFSFDGADGLERMFFQVGDDGPRRASNIPTGTADYDRSTSMEFWLRTNSLSDEQILFESGDSSAGISVTLGDADSDGKTNDLRFRIHGYVGPLGGNPIQPAESMFVTAQIDRFADPTEDFVHLTAVFSDDPNNRFAEIYVNGALAGRVDGPLGVEESLQWDSYDPAGLGNRGGVAVGAAGGSGDLPFQGGGFRGDMALFRFHNHAIEATEIAQSYNSVLGPTDYSVVAVTGDGAVPSERPTNVSLGTSESSHLAIMHERADTLSSELGVDALIGGVTLLSSPAEANPGTLEAGREISSFLLQFDPLGDGAGSIESVVGAIEFEGDILGILLDPLALEASDSLLGSIGDYGLTADRGLLLGTEGFLAVSSDQKTLSFGLSVAGDEMLQFRVITELIEEADFNQDASVDGHDLAVWNAAYSVSSSGDADGDGASTGLDFLTWQTQASQTFPSSDFNFDGLVDAADLAVWAANYGASTNGDADQDGLTTGLDFLTWQTERIPFVVSIAAAASSVPEPSTLLLFLCTLPAACFRGSRQEKLTF